MEGSKHFQSAQLVQEMGTEKGTAVIASIISIYVPDAAEGAESNADLGNSRRKLKIAMGADARRRHRGGGRSVLAAGRLRGLTEDADSELKAELTKKNHEVAR